MRYVGIDYHKRYSVVCIVDEVGNMIAEERIEHTFPERFQQLLSAHTPCQVGFEATMNWGGGMRFWKRSPGSSESYWPTRCMCG